MKPLLPFFLLLFFQLNAGVENSGFHYKRPAGDGYLACRKSIGCNPSAGTGAVAGSYIFGAHAGSAGLSMVFVDGGTFNMGENSPEPGEKPVHAVTVSSFYISKYLVTQAQWRAVMGTNPCFVQCDDCPVENITWDEAQEFCQKESGLTGKTYRLPTEAEWEYAARGGIKTSGYTYSGGNDIDEIGWYAGNAGNKTHPVGQKKPNELGIYDMTGNVWEWCSDWYNADYYKSSPLQNPEGALAGQYRVLRGGGFISLRQDCRVACRNYSKPGSPCSVIGLRPVVTDR